MPCLKLLKLATVRIEALKISYTFSKQTCDNQHVCKV